MFFVNVIWILVVIPIRVSFEDPKEISIQIVLIDFIVDSLFIADHILDAVFVTFLNSDGYYVFDRKVMVRKYFRSLIFPIICMSFLPMSLFKYTSGPGGKDDF
jgi:hypothetical protein